MVTNWAERRHALAELTECARWIARRDELVRQAAATGLAKDLIAGMLGIHRSTVYEILAKPEAPDRGGEQADS